MKSSLCLSIRTDQIMRICKKAICKKIHNSCTVCADRIGRIVWLIAPVLKTGIGSSLSRVRIPPYPPK